MTRLLAALLPAFMLAGCFTQPPAPSVDRAPTAQSKGPVASAANGAARSGHYTVRKGDTLYRIAMEHGQDYRDIAGWNNITNPDSIKEGQVLRVAPPAAEPANGTVVSKPIATGSVVEARPLDKSPAPASSPAPAASDGVKREPKVNKEPYSAEGYARLNGTGEAASRPAEPKPEPKPGPRPEVAPVSMGADDIAWAWPSAGKVLAAYSENTNKGLDLGGKSGDPVFAAGDGRVVYAGSGLRGYGQLVIVKHNNSFLSAYAHNQKILVKEKQEVTRGQKIAEMGDTDSDKVKLHFEIRRQGKPIDPLIYLPKR
ncbi:MAG: Peptidoglycan-binding LysM:Peptidase [Rhodocyclaceae bacterium]|nr:Peptidoglycan-binding LysM:Peptidase [Rhodocyclaceae bacterium]